MKSLKFLGIVISLFTYTLSISCNKYLDKKNSNAITVPSTLADLQGLLDDGLVMNEDITPAMGEASCTDYFFEQDRYDDASTFNQQLYRWQVGDYFYANDWSKGYGPIYNANYCLEMLDKIALNATNEKAWKNVKGSALFFRAFNFLNLVWQYGKAYDESTSEADLGIVLRITSDFNVPSIRSNVKACYERIIIDAKEAATLLEDLPQHFYRPSKAAALGLLARAYWSMRDYSNALLYADSCLSIKSALLNYATDINASNTRPFQNIATNKEIIFYTEMNRSISSMRVGNIDTTLYESYAESDLRKTAFFRPRSPYFVYKGTYTGSTTTFFSGIATDEIYLIKAECEARLGNKDKALDALNTLLSNRWKDDGTWIPIEASDADEALEIVLLERRKELLFRGLRWIDIKRLNKENRNITLERIVNGQSVILQPNSGYYALPLPKDIIDLTGIQQNN